MRATVSWSAYAFNCTMVSIDPLRSERTSGAAAHLQSKADREARRSRNRRRAHVLHRGAVSVTASARARSAPLRSAPPDRPTPSPRVGPGRRSPWRDLPPWFGKWNSVFVRFRDRVRADVFKRLFDAVSDHPDMEYAMVDATIVRVHRHGQGAKGGLRARP